MNKNKKQILTIVYLVFLNIITQHYLFNGATILLKIIAFTFSILYSMLTVVAIFDFNSLENLGKEND